MSWGGNLWVGDLRRAIEGVPDDSALAVTVVDASGGAAWADGLRLEAGDLPWGGAGAFLDVYVDGSVSRRRDPTPYDGMPL